MSKSLLESSILYLKKVNKTFIPPPLPPALHHLPRLSPSHIRFSLLLAFEYVHDLRFGNQRTQSPNDGVDVPHLGVGLEEAKLDLTLGLELGPVLREGLELVDELVHDVPQPLVGQLQLYLCGCSWLCL